MSLADDFFDRAGRSVGVFGVLGVFGIEGLPGAKRLVDDLGVDKVLGIWLNSRRISGLRVGTVAPMRCTPGSMMVQLVVATE